MHKLSPYELYLFEENRRYGYETTEENDYPAWLKLENDAYYWIFRLSRKMPFVDRSISNRVLNRIEMIPNIRFLRYRDISPSLKQAFKDLSEEFSSLREDYKLEKMWDKPNVLSDLGMERWTEATFKVHECRDILPDPDWRENWEKERLYPYCTRKEAELIAFEFIKQEYDLNLYEKTEKNRSKYYYYRKAKDGKFKMEFGKCIYSDVGYDTDIVLGVAEVDMLSRDVRIQKCF